MILVDTLLQLQLLKEIGQEGRNSKVFISFDPQLDANLVVKQVDKTDFTEESKYFNEAQMLYATQHPNIMPVRFASQDDKNVYIAMDYYKNGSLNSLINARFLKVREIIKYSLEFLSGIHYIHTKKLVHFDIKPTNILLNDAFKAVVTDFGLSKYLNEYGFAEPDFIYSFHTPPEAYQFSKSSTGFDIYQAGVTIYRMANGNNHFKKQLDELNITNPDELGAAIQRGRFPKRDAFLPHIPNKLQNIIKKALEIDMSRRYLSILDMINDLSNIDENLDWMYNEDETAHTFYWERHNETHKFIIHLEKKSNELWDVSGSKIRKSDNRTIRISDWCSSGYPSKENAFKEIRNILKYNE